MTVSAPQIWEVGFEAPLQSLEDYAFALEALGASLTWALDDDLPPLLPATAFVAKQEAYDAQRIEHEIQSLFENHGLKPVALTVQLVPEKDWVLENQKQFPPLTIGGFFLYSPLMPVAAPQGLIPINLTAAVAFGSGEHATTQGCILALEMVKKQGVMAKSALDMGCGSGILAMVIAKLWPEVPILACDFDLFAVKTAQENAAINTLPQITALHSDGFEKIQGQTFDLIAANILANPLIEMAPAMVAHLNPGGRIILSGLLESQAADVLKPYRYLGMKCLENFGIAGWSTLSLIKE